MCYELYTSTLCSVRAGHKTVLLCADEFDVEKIFAAVGLSGVSTSPVTSQAASRAVDDASAASRRRSVFDADVASGTCDDALFRPILPALSPLPMSPAPPASTHSVRLMRQTQRLWLI